MRYYDHDSKQRLFHGTIGAVHPGLILEAQKLFREYLVLTESRTSITGVRNGRLSRSLFRISSYYLNKLGVGLQQTIVLVRSGNGGAESNY